MAEEPMQVGERYIFLVTREGYILQVRDIVDHLIGIGEDLAKHMSVVTMEVVITKPAAAYVCGLHEPLESSPPASETEAPSCTRSSTS